MQPGACSCGRRGVYRDRSLCRPCYQWRRKRGLLMPALRSTEEESFFSRVRAGSGPLDCWLWTGTLSKGYGIFWSMSRKKRMVAHRWAYRFLRGDVPDHLVLDHLCRNRSCVNPWHVEPVTPVVNSLRGDSPSIRIHRTGSCARGHDPARMRYYGSRRSCLECDAQRAAHRTFSRRSPKPDRLAFGLPFGHLRFGHRIHLGGRSIVYYLERADGLVKVGTTTNYQSRRSVLIRQHGPLKLIAWEFGDADVERRRHDEFGHLRVAILAEWFEPGHELLEHVRALRKLTVNDNHGHDRTNV